MATAVKFMYDLVLCTLLDASSSTIETKLMYLCVIRTIQSPAFETADAIVSLTASTVLLNFQYISTPAVSSSYGRVGTDVGTHDEPKTISLEPWP